MAGCGNASVLRLQRASFSLGGLGVGLQVSRDHRWAAGRTHAAPCCRVPPAEAKAKPCLGQRRAGGTSRGGCCRPCGPPPALAQTPAAPDSQCQVTARAERQNHTSISSSAALERCLQ